MLRVQQRVKQWYYRYYSLWACLLHDCSCCFVRVEKEKERMCMRKLASQTEGEKGEMKEKRGINAHVCCMRVCTCVRERESCLVLWIMLISRVRVVIACHACNCSHIVLNVQSAYYRHLIFATMELGMGNGKYAKG